MKHICFYFQVHQPFRLRPFHFFNIGKGQSYFDDKANAEIMRKVACKCYLPANSLLQELIEKHEGRFKISFSISGTTLEQFKLYAPEVLESFQKLARTGAVEFLAETYAHSLSALKSKEEFRAQVNRHSCLIYKYFRQYPRIFRNTELIYSDTIASLVHDMGFEAMLTEGAGHILGWRSPNFLYCSAGAPQLKLLLKNYRLSDDIAFRFSNRQWEGWPLTATKFVQWLQDMPQEEEIINLFMDYETFGEHQWEETGIFEFMKALPETVFSSSQMTFVTPSEAVSALQPMAPLHIPWAISWADEERDLTAWLGNDLQEDAFNSLYRLEDKVRKCKNNDLWQDWLYLQTSDHFYYMCTKYFSDGDVHKYFNPYENPYEAFINYMNVLSDFEIRVDRAVQHPEHALPVLSTAGYHRESTRKNKPFLNLN